MMFYKMNDTIYPASKVKIDKHICTKKDGAGGFITTYGLYLKAWDNDELFDAIFFHSKDALDEVFRVICMYVSRGTPLINIDELKERCFTNKEDK